MRTFYYIVLSGILALGLVACSKGPEDEAGLKPIVIQPDWYPQPEQGGFFMAKAAGIYEEFGLSVEILDTSPNIPFVQRVAKGDATVGFTRLDLLIEAISKGLPLMIIGKYAEHSPVSIMVPEASDIHSFPDLDDKRVMAAIFVPYVDFIQAHYDIKMRLFPHNWGTAQFMAGELDAQQAYITSEPFYVERLGMPVRTLLVADSGYDPPHVVFTNEENWKTRKDDLLAFFEATMEGWLAYLEDDPSPANEVIGELNPKMDAEFMAWSREVLIEEGLIWGRGEEKREAWGKLEKEEVAMVVQQLQKIGQVPDLDSEEFPWVDFDFVWSEDQD
ncbi:MAG: ABC transporter substrate-binding protein [Verrucomicrobiota bacterium]